VKDATDDENSVKSANYRYSGNSVKSPHESVKSTEDNEKPVKTAALKAASVNTDGESGKVAEEDDIVRAEGRRGRRHQVGCLHQVISRSTASTQ